MPVLIMLHYRFARLKYSHTERLTDLNQSTTGIPPDCIMEYSVGRDEGVRTKKDERPPKGPPASNSHLYNIITYRNSRQDTSIKQSMRQEVKTTGIMGRFNLSRFEKEYKE